jgi:hypothetical protein
MEIYRKQAYIKRSDTFPIYMKIAEKQFMSSFFREIPMEDLKKLVNFRVLDPDNQQDWEDKNYTPILQNLREMDNVLFSSKLVINEIHVEDNTIVEFAEWLREECYDVGDKWYYQEDNITYTSEELLVIFKIKKSLSI